MLVKAFIFASFFYLSVGAEDTGNPPKDSDLNSVTNIELLTNLLNSTKHAFKIYDRKLDHSIPWEYLSNAINVMGLDLNDYSSGAVNHVTNAGQSIRLGLDKSYLERRKVFGWAVFTKTVLESYLRVIKLTNFTDTTVIFDTIDRSSNIFTNVFTGFEGVLDHYSNAVGELESLNNQLERDKADGSSFLSQRIETIRTETNYNSPEISTFGGVLEFLQKVEICKCKDMLNYAFVGLTLEDEISYKSELVSKKLEIIKAMYDDIKTEINRIIVKIRDFRQKLEHEINLMRKCKSQMEYNGVKNFPIFKEIHGPIIEKLIFDCEDYIQTQTRESNKLH